MGIFNKRIGDVTVGDIIFWGALVDMVRQIFKLTSTPKESRDEYHPELPPGHRHNLWAEFGHGSEEAKKIKMIRREKWMGNTPKGGWDQYRHYEKYLEDVQIYPPHMKDPLMAQDILDLPDWILKPPAGPPRNYDGYRVDEHGEIISIDG